jgi:hypothetical protein
MAARLLSNKWYFISHHFAQAFIPIAGCGVFLGLSALTITLLHGEGVIFTSITAVRMLALTGASLWTLVLLWQISAVHQHNVARRLLAMIPLSAAVIIASLTWASLFVKIL